jgi:uncharacterized membrane protein
VAPEPDRDARRRRWRRWRPRLSRRTELTGAILAAAGSLTPSLLPKTVVIQGVITGVTATLGYGVAALLRWFLGPARQRIDERTRARIEAALLTTAVLALIPTAWYSGVWQHQVAESVGSADPPPTNAVLALLIAAAILTTSVLVAHALRVTVRWMSRGLSRWLPRGVAAVVATTVVFGGVIGLTDRIIRHHVLVMADESFRLVNREASPDLPPPTGGLRSGGPGSAVAWSDLGHTGRDFVSLADPPGPIRPIRVYAGIDSAADLDARAGLVVTELERTGALERSAVCVVVTTGTGWVDPAAVRALEAQYGGDTAIAAMQYSYLPSALSLLIDQLRVDAAATALVTAVVRRWQALPVGQRPRLLLYGESLGSRGAEVALRDVPGARELFSGVLLVGPLNSNPTWSELVARREPGSPMLAPVVDGGRSVRFGPGPEVPGTDRTTQPWPTPPSGPRMLYLQHPSDPIVWWSPSLLWSPPDWVRERGVISRAPPLRWQPIVTFWQVSGDFGSAGEVPRGHGHRYGNEMAAAWAAVAPNPSN